MEVIIQWMFTVFLVTSAFKSCHSQLNGPNPKTAVLRGETVVMKCSKTAESPNQLSWVDDTDGAGILMFLGSGQISFEEKYNNFEVISDTDQLDLQINAAEVLDEGVYMCQLAGTSIQESTTMTVEVQAASMPMTQDGSDVETVTVTAGVPSDIVCTASGARPAVKIEWYHRIDGQGYTNITSSASDVVSDNGDDTFDTVSTLTYDTIKEYNNGGLRCITTGQKVAGSLEDTATLAVQYPPTVTLQYGSDTVTCSADAYPAVPLVPDEPNGYKIIVNNTDVYTPTCADDVCTLELKVDYDTDVRCNATNSVGTGTKTIVAVPGAVITTAEPPTPTTKPGGGGGDGGPSVGGIVGGVLAAVVGITVMIIIVIVVMKKKNNGKKSPKTSSEIPMTANGSGADKPDRPTPAPRDIKGDADENAEGRKVKPNDNPDGILYAQLDLNNQNKSASQKSGNNIIRTDEPTEYADVKTFIQSPATSPTSPPPSSPST